MRTKVVLNDNVDKDTKSIPVKQMEIGDYFYDNNKLIRKTSNFHADICNCIDVLTGRKSDYYDNYKVVPCVYISTDKPEGK